MISYIPVLILFAYGIVDYCEGFCKNGTIYELVCPRGSLMSGVQTTSEIFSADATPMCSKMSKHIRFHYGSTTYFYKSSYSSFGHSFIDPKASCSSYYEGFAIRSISICFENGEIIETSADCSQLKSISYSDVYRVQGEPNGPVLKCKEGSVLNSIKYERDHEDNLVAVAHCIQQKRPPSLENCSVGDQTDYSFRVSCYEDGVFGLEQSFQMEVSGRKLSPAYNISSRSPDFLVGGLRPGTTYNLKIYVITAKGRSPPLRIKASTLPSRRGFCKEGEEVEIDCPEGYLVTGVKTSSKIFSKDATAMCSQIANKTVADSKTSRLRLYYEPNPLVRADCGGSEPVLLKFSMCFVNGHITKTKTHCLRIRNDVSVGTLYHIAGPVKRSSLECLQGSFFSGFRMERDGRDFNNDSNVHILGNCTMIEE